MSALRLLLDEDVPVIIELAVRRRVAGADVLLVGQPDTPPKGTKDPELLTWCEGAGRILVTLDRRTMPGHLAAHLGAGRHSPGVLIVKRKARLAEVIDDLVLILEASSPDDWRDRAVSLPV